MLIKKYGNRRLYDTESSRYITLEELTGKIRDGADVRVIDAKSGADLTGATLTQVIFEARGAGNLLPTQLLHQLIRLGDDVLADFLGRYVQGALELYIQARKTSHSLLPFNPFASLLQAAQASPLNPWSQAQQPPTMAPPAPPIAAPVAAAEGEVQDLRRELEELKRSLRKRKK